MSEPAPALPPPAANQEHQVVPHRERLPSVNLAPPAAPPVAARPRTRGTTLFGIAAIVIFFGSFAAWSALAPLSEAAIAPGMIKVEGTRRTIQHLEGGIVREIMVRDGDRVRAGQVLIRLDDIRAGSDLETLRSQRWALLAQDARLAAELDDSTSIRFPTALRNANEPRAEDAMLGQTAVFEARRAALTSQVAVQEARIGQQEAVTAGATGQLRAQRQQLELIRQEEAMTRTLVQQGLQRLPTLLALQRSAAALEGQGEDLRGQLERAAQTMTEARSTIASIVGQRREEAAGEQREIRVRLAEVEEKLRAAQDVAVRRDIVAPEDGTVLNLRLFTVGAVVRPGDPVMDLVPTQDRLIAEVNIQPNDIDVVHVGLQAEVRLPAFKQRLVPYLHGHVTFVAQDVTTDERTRQTYYRAHILIDQEQLARTEGVQLVPGMPVEAMIQIGERSFLRYITQPVRDSFTRAFREQ
ncbi:HlyD family type I secretion periplasmic adaptor subunit [Roseomonas terrae]|jgi:HlyD family secretion protein|uniref:Membrane fusion protein (MFP) family protein n=1 Tax=Neoroseomonas terrae TaxID=424799 RepID=A0ABS5EF06_9PROT|nr:HlyD family type I secretion periplasmic adaptor subunit [Neoroseomonas terrae]MBR0649600.1 HlyD family type I secretion periplasmic adaptor subunit [Neoroseomonas terrae]